MTDIITQIKALKAKATAGEWEHSENRDGVQAVGGPDDYVCTFALMREDDHSWIHFDDAEANAALIVALVNHSDELIERVERAEAALKTMQKMWQVRDAMDAEYRNSLKGEKL